MKHIITKNELLKNRSWNINMIPLYLKPLSIRDGGMANGNRNYSYTEVLKVEHFLNNLNINFKN